MNGIPDECERAYNDCNCNDSPDECDITIDDGGLCQGEGCSNDCQLNGIPDECEPGDPDGDGDVELFDFAVFQVCFTGDEPTDLDSGCCLFDVEPDGDVDLEDYAALQAELTGP